MRENVKVIINLSIPENLGSINFDKKTTLNFYVSNMLQPKELDYQDMFDPESTDIKVKNYKIVYEKEEDK